MVTAILILAVVVLLAYGLRELAPWASWSKTSTVQRNPQPPRRAVASRAGGPMAPASATGATALRPTARDAPRQDAPRQDASRQPAGAAALNPAWGLLVAYPAATLIALNGLILVCWIVMVQWYSLPGHYNTLFFAFDKIPDHYNSPILQATTLLFAAIAVMYGVSYAVLRTMARLSRRLKLTLLSLILAAAVVNILFYPVGALDVYIYLLWLKMPFFYHQNPYLVTFQSYGVGATDPIAKFGSYLLGQPLPYGPTFVVLHGVPALLSGFTDAQIGVLSLKIVNLILVGLTGLAIYRYQRDERQGWLAAYLFLANPLVLFEAVGNAHNDIITAVFLIAALLYFQRQSLLGGPLFMLSVLVKFFSGALIPLFGLAMVLQRWSRRKLALSALFSLLTVVVLFAPFWDGGQMIGGLTTGMSQAQDMSSTSVASLLREYLSGQGASTGTISAAHTIVVAIFAVAALAVMWAVWRGRAIEAGLIDTFLLFSALIPLLFPWYLIPALALIALRATPVNMAYLLGATALGLLYYPLSVWAWFNSGMSVFQIHLFQAAFLTLPIALYFAIEVGNWGLRRPVPHPASAVRPG